MLQTPLALRCGLLVSNRIVKASMTERLADLAGAPTSEIVRLYQRFAAGGVGLMLTGNVMVDAAHLEAVGNAVLDSDRALAGFAAWAAAGSAMGVPTIVQLNHPGRQAPRTLLQQPVAPSSVGLRKYGFFAQPRALSAKEIEQLIERFADSALLAERAGFAGVEIHAAHGYLLSQFLSPNVNRRTDAWGGSLDNRARILLRVVDRVRERVSSQFAVGVKLNAGDFVKGGLMPADAAQVMRWLDQRELDFIELSGGTFERPASFGAGLSQSTKAREGYFLELAAEARRVTSIPLIVTGGFRSKQAMQDALASGACDLIGLARPLAVEPDLPKRMLAGTAERAVQVKLALPRGPVGSLAELYWYREQLGRLALGVSSKQRGSGLLSLVTQMLQDIGKLLCQLCRRRVSP